jgi:hypothetical protein
MAQGQETQKVRTSGLAAALAAAATIFTGGSASVAFATTFAVSYGFGTYAQARARKQAAKDVVSRRDVIRSSSAPHRMIYGAVRTAGVLVYAEVTGTEKEYLHLVVAVAGHEVHSIDDVWLDETLLGPLDVDGVVQTGVYDAGSVRIKKHLGTSTQTADAALVAETAGGWTTAHRLRGIAYVYIRLIWNQDLFTGIPNFTFMVRGRKCFDPRDGVTKFTENPVLHLRDYLLAGFGLGGTAAEIDDTVAAASANICEGWVSLGSVSLTPVPDHTTDTWSLAGNVADVTLSTGDRLVLSGTPVPTGLTSGATYYVIRRDKNLYQLAADYQLAIEGTAVSFSSNGSGTQTWSSIEQRKYTSNGSFTLDQEPPDVEEYIRATMAGRTVYSGGKWLIYAGTYRAPVEAIDESSLSNGTVVARPRRARRELANSIRGTYTEPARGWATTDFPVVTSATFVAEDGGRAVDRSIDLAWVTNAYRAQRLSRIYLKRSRTQLLQLVGKLYTIVSTPADNVEISIGQLGYADKSMQVSAMRLVVPSDGGGPMRCEFTFEEDTADIYDWTDTDATAPASVVPLQVGDPTTVVPPTTLTFASGNAQLLKGRDGSIVSRILATWAAAAEPTIGGYEVQWKRTTDIEYSVVTLPASGTSAWIEPVQDGLVYDVRVRTVRAISGQKSAWLSGTHTVVGKTAAPTTPTSLTTVSVQGGVALYFSQSPDPDYNVTEIYEAASNDWTHFSRGKIAEIRGTQYNRTGIPFGDIRYFWVVHRDTSGNTSDRFPTTVSGNAGVAGTPAALSLGTNAVDTINIVSAAVTDVTSAYTAATVVISAGTWTTVQSITVTTTGEPLLIKSTAHANTNAGVPNFASHQVRIQRDGTTIYGPVTPTAYVMADGFVAVALLDTPSAGTYTYTLDLFPSHGCGVDGRYLEALETKR